MSSAWVTRYKPNPLTTFRLFCFPYAGAGIAVFYPWVEQFLPHIELCAIQLPGRENRLREQPCTRLVSLVESIADDIQPFLDMPFAFFGHSMGALIAFEMARQLRHTNNRTPEHLFVSGRRAPQLPDPLPPLYGLADQTFLTELRLRYEGVPEILWQDPELMQLYLPIIKADLQVVETYAYVNELPLSIPISCFGGWHDRTLSHLDLEAWCLQTQGKFRCEMFTGGHFYFQQDRALLPRIIMAELSAANIG